MWWDNPEVVVDTTDTMDLKLKALACHVSQIKDMAALEKRIRERGRSSASPTASPTPRRSSASSWIDDLSRASRFSGRSAGSAGRARSGDAVLSRVRRDRDVWPALAGERAVRGGAAAIRRRPRRHDLPDLSHVRGILLHVLRRAAAGRHPGAAVSHPRGRRDGEHLPRFRGARRGHHRVVSPGGRRIRGRRGKHPPHRRADGSRGGRPRPRLPGDRPRRHGVSAVHVGQHRPAARRRAESRQRGRHRGVHGRGRPAHARRRGRLVAPALPRHGADRVQLHPRGAARRFIYCRPTSRTRASGSS